MNILILSCENVNGTTVSVYAHNAHGLTLAKADATDHRQWNGAHWSQSINRPLNSRLNVKESWEADEGITLIEYSTIIGYIAASFTGR